MILCIFVSPPCVRYSLIMAQEVSEHVAGEFQDLGLVPSKVYFCFNC